MATMVKLKINGREVSVPEGTNLIDAAQEAGVHIPNLCYLKGMKGIGACRLCLVEIEGSKGASIACNTKAKEGMVVSTETDAILDQRKFVIDLILSMHPLDCMTCTKAGVCNLQQYAYDFGIKKSTFSIKQFGHPIESGNPFIKLDPDYCILCGRCVRVCKAQDTNVLDFMGRGVGARVGTATDKPMQESGCTFCGSCLDACPVNAIIEADRWRKGREWEYEKTSSACLTCGDACVTVVNTKDGGLQKINAGGKDGAPSKYICALGRYGFDAIGLETRATSPMLRSGGALKEVSWDDALAAAADKLKAAGAEAGFLSSASILNEDALTLMDLAANVVKTSNIDTTMAIYGDAASFAASDHVSVDEADLIVAVGINPSQKTRALPALNASIRKRVGQGAGLIVVNANATDLDNAATARISGDETGALKSLIAAAIEKGAKADKELAELVKGAAITEEAAKAGELLAKSRHAVVYASAALFDAASNVALISGGAACVSLESNARGVALSGLASGKGKSYRELVSGGAKVLYVIGNVPLKDRPDVDFLIVQDSYLSPLAKKADVFLPMATQYEASGSVVDYHGAIKQISAAVEPAGDSWVARDIFVAISKAMGKAIKAAKDTEIKAALKKKLTREPKPFEKRPGFDVDTVMVVESLNDCALATPRLIWLKEADRAARV